MNRFSLVLTGIILGGVGTYAGTSLLLGHDLALPPAPAVREVTSYRDIVKRVLPGVVSIDAQSKAAPRRNRPMSEEDNPDNLGFGSGFLISAKGVVVTNNHVVEGADLVVVQLQDGRKYTSKTIRTDPKTDLAVVLLDTKDELPFLQFGDSDTMEIGDRVLAVGAPFRLTGTVTQGIISSKGRALKMNMYEDFLQTDAAINPGNSGGPLINLDGKVIGVNSAIKSRSGGFSGIGLAISSNLGKTIVESLIKDGVVKRGYLGIGMTDVDEAAAKDLKLEKPLGIRVTRVYPDAPGDKAGLKSDDVITKLNGRALRDGKDLQTIVAGLPLGKPVDVEVVRDGKTMTLQVTIQEQPRTFGTTSRGPRIPEIGKGSYAIDKVGLVVTDLTPELAETLGYPDGVRGALIVKMTRRGLAAASGLQAGWVVTEVDRKAVKSAETMVKAVEDGSTTKGIAMTVRGARTEAREVMLREE